MQHIVLILKLFRIHVATLYRQRPPMKNLYRRLTATRQHFKSQQMATRNLNQFTEIDSVSDDEVLNCLFLQSRDNNSILNVTYCTNHKLIKAGKVK
ncbi:hypothetical protein ACJIZ3_005146 [Penstemon smallii]|uniref:Uncharacterized protein n=1 Tax=Penstemon smallii TaxID=265156 RepID=A0ABD3S431_9LAMI